jgi:hypothetical protein
MGSSPYETTYTVPAEKNNSVLKIKVKLIDDNGNEIEDNENVSVNF